jgi:hypothetical protein
MESLVPGGRLVLLELGLEDSWPSWFRSLVCSVIKPFGCTEEWVERCPWETIPENMYEILTDVSTTKYFLGTTYIIHGMKPNKTDSKNTNDLTLQRL